MARWVAAFCLISTSHASALAGPLPTWSVSGESRIQGSGSAAGHLFGAAVELQFQRHDGQGRHATFRAADVFLLHAAHPDAAGDAAISVTPFLADLTFLVTDGASGQTGAVQFRAEIGAEFRPPSPDGTGWGRASFSWVGESTRHLHVGHNRYTLTLSAPVFPDALTGGATGEWVRWAGGSEYRFASGVAGVGARLDVIPNPEPGTLVMAVVGLAALGVRSRRRARRS